MQMIGKPCTEKEYMMVREMSPARRENRFTTTLHVACAVIGVSVLIAFLVLILAAKKSSTATMDEILVVPGPTCPNYFGDVAYNPADAQCCHSFESGTLCAWDSACCCHGGVYAESGDCMGGVQCCKKSKCEDQPHLCPKHLNHNATDDDHREVVDQKLCGHSASECNPEHPSAPSYFTDDCWSGGIGCNAFGKKCCRFCSFGFYKNVQCKKVPARSSKPEQDHGFPQVSLKPPDEDLFEKRVDHWFRHQRTEIAGPKATNKFWTNWVVSTGGDYPIYPMPYVLKWEFEAQTGPRLLVSHESPGSTSIGGVIRSYQSPFFAGISLGVSEADSVDPEPVLVSEGLFGIHVEMRGPDRKVTFPIISGMAYVTGFYEGGFTPYVDMKSGIKEVKKISNGVFYFVNLHGKEFRVYLLNREGEFADDSYTFIGPTGSVTGRLNRPLEGAVRVAHVTVVSDRKIYDDHAKAVVTGIDLELHGWGQFKYKFAKRGAKDVLPLHYAYATHVKLMNANKKKSKFQVLPDKIEAPTKGHMQAVAGDEWHMSVDNIHDFKQLSFLPEKEPRSGLDQILREATEASLKTFEENWMLLFGQSDPITGVYHHTGYYSTGQRFQKLAMLCLLSEKFFGIANERTRSCVEVLWKGFRCLYNRKEPECLQVSKLLSPMYYDEQWGGIVSSAGYNSSECVSRDYGNACYNAHHYHFGYFVVTAAVLARLEPELLKDKDPVFVRFVNALVRDTATPSSNDRYFPRFRNFDWFDLHSWSRGLSPLVDGKSAESSSDELNLLWGMKLWGKELGHGPLEKMSTLMLALASLSIREFFLIRKGSPHYQPDFAAHRVVGILFHNKVQYATWFQQSPEYIHGMQMVPLTPAMRMTRTPEYCAEEWTDVVSKLPLWANNSWTGILLAGSQAMTQPQEAFHTIQSLPEDHFQRALSRAWALYWAATQ